MRTYPIGVMQNFAPPGAPVDIRPVPQSNWYMFCDKQQATQVHAWVLAIPGCIATHLIDAVNYYPQFVYEADATVKPYCIEGPINVNGMLQSLLGFAGDVYDRNLAPNPQIDKFTPPQPHALGLIPLNPQMSQLYWYAIQA